MVVRDRSSATIVARASDCLVSFAHAAWNGSRVGIYVDGTYCGPIEVAYDTSARRVEPFSVMAKEVAASIVASYGVTAEELAANGGNAIKWASCDNEPAPSRSIREFEKRFPQTR